MRILVTGGLGYIGSHTVVELLAVGHEAVIVDNLANSKLSVLERLEEITGAVIPFKQIDVADVRALAAVFDEFQFDGVIHFAGLKAVGESVAQPLTYYRANIDTTLALCEVMQSKGVKSLIFSSSATVYGDASAAPFKESAPTGIGISNPYGQTKYMLEQILRDLKASDSSWQITLLRYFNPIGAHASGLIGEDPAGIPNNLLPYIQQVAIGKLEQLSIYGGDYDTPDGTCLRDYIHVTDLARGHIAALKQLASQAELGVYNLGTGQGVSVLEAVHAFEKACGRTLPYQIVDRRPGDLAVVYSDASKAKQELGWQTVLSLDQACQDAWKWQQYAAGIG